MAILPCKRGSRDEIYKREYQSLAEFLEVSARDDLPNAKSASSEEEHEMGEVPANMELLYPRDSASDCEHLVLSAEDCLKSRMRENRTYGSVRGGRQSSH